VRTKADLVPIPERESEEGIPVSIVTGEGLDRLRKELGDRLFSGPGGYAELEPMLTRERHRVALERSAAALAAARLELGKDAVLVAHHLRDAVGALEELIGVVHPDEVLARVFERFCVGK
jgi:tRNA modification GTPase